MNTIYSNNLSDFFNPWLRAIKSKKILLTLLALLILSFAWQHHKAHSLIQAPMLPPVIVELAKVQTKQWTEHLSAVGSVKAFHGVTLSPQVSGVVASINFKSGDSVQAGQLLLTLDSNDLLATRDSNQAKFELAKANYQRNLILYKNKFTSAADLDSLRSQMQQAAADVRQSDALIAQRQIKAPFSGKLGINQVDLGQYVAAGQALVSVETLTPIYVDFTLPEKYAGQVQVGNKIYLNSNKNTKPLIGEVIAISPEVDPTTRNFTVRAQTENKDLTLLPGMFAKVNVDLNKAETKIVVPQTAISYGPDGTAVFIVEQGKAHAKTIEVGSMRGDLASINHGLQAGDTVVVAGLNKLHEGSAVVSQQTIAAIPGK